LNKDADSPIKLIDFGLSVKFSGNEKKNVKQMGTLVGTSYYMAPEVMNGKYDQICDIWSMGVILYILVSSVPPFNG
jgi:calcium-dependent protein kinase